MIFTVSLILTVLLFDGMETIAIWSLPGILAIMFAMWMYFARFPLALAYAKIMKYAKKHADEGVADEKTSESVFLFLKAIFGIVSLIIFLICAFFFSWKPMLHMFALFLLSLVEMKDRF